MRKVLLGILGLVALLACSRQNKIDQAKFERLFQVGNAIRTLSSPNGTMFDAYLKQFDIECLTARSLITTEAERDMISRYEMASAVLKQARTSHEKMLSGRGSSQEADDNWEYALFLINQAGGWYEAGEIKAIIGTQSR